MLLHHERHGTGGPPVVVLHGLFGSGENWRTPGRRLGEHGYDVVLADLPNHGRSPHAAAMDLTSMARDVAALLDALAWRDAHLVGHSLGGKVAMQLALDAPQRLRSLVVVDIAARPTASANAAVLAALRALDPTRLASRGEADAALAARLPDRGERQFLLKNLERDERGGWRWRLGLDGIAASWAALQRAPHGGGASQLPALFLRGERSPYLGEGDLPAIRALFPRAELVTVAGAGHWVHVDRPEETLAAIEAHLGAVERARAEM
jgi:pimeloyl-ACP methyl ester carboxylesterase